MTRRFLSTTAIVGALMASPAFAADLARKAPPMAPLPPPVQDWSGFYSGIEGGYGWGTDSFEQSINQFNNGGAANVFDILNGTSTTGILFPAFTGLGGPNSIDTSGWLFGGFVGAQKQWGNWVIGLEADYDWASITGSANASRTEHGVNVSLLTFGSPSVSGTAFIGATDVTITGQAFLTCPTPVTCAGGTPYAPGTVIQPGAALFVQQVFNGQGLNGINNGSNGTTLASGVINVRVFTPVVVAPDGSVTTFIPLFRTTATTAPVFGSVNASVLQQAFFTADVSRSIHVDTKIDELGSLRGKFGWAFAPNWMVYGTGGLAWAHAQTNINTTETLRDPEDGDVIASRSRNAVGGTTMLGVRLGGRCRRRLQSPDRSGFGLGLRPRIFTLPVPEEHDLARRQW
jgi:opacity protein-like surface antigen